MSISLDPISIADLQALASCETPLALLGQCANGALPPAFVASRALEHLRNGKPYIWCSTFYIRANDGTVIGGCGFKDIPHAGRVEIGYAVSREHQGRGTATEAIRLLLAFPFESGDVKEVFAQISEQNIASTRVVQKLGFASRGIKTDSDGELLVQWVACAT